MHKHPLDCQCFQCSVWTEADRRMDAGEIDPWQLPELLVGILAEVISIEKSAVVREARIEIVVGQLYIACGEIDGKARH